jgi:hypothetical protein
VRAIELVATHGWRLLPAYEFDQQGGIWRYRGLSRELATSLDQWRFSELCSGRYPAPPVNEALELGAVLAAAEATLTAPVREGSGSSLQLSEQGERLRWFVLPQEVSAELAAHVESGVA